MGGRKKVLRGRIPGVRNASEVEGFFYSQSLGKEGWKNKEKGKTRESVLSGSSVEILSRFAGNNGGGIL